MDTNRRKNYQAETSYLRNIVAELRTNEVDMNSFELVSLVNRLDRENTEFETLHIINQYAVNYRRHAGVVSGKNKLPNINGG